MNNHLRTWLWELSNPSASDEDYETQSVDAEGAYSLFENGLKVGIVDSLEKAEHFKKNGHVAQVVAG